ncbi:DUF2786 domain-containing protein [Microbacterium sp.]|uniref:DUF2786 domain-containing protein n=1 Tax=Microbacterium sp. TaxID=51671 RepID=UPI0028127456|nr:DUF2786 domain-containing protein [Microbacterium sp.]
MTESKVDLIAKLLAKAESTTPEEAEALTEHAERLMVKYGIEQARLDERRARLGREQEEIKTERMLFSGAYARDIRELGAGIAAALGTLRALYGRHSDGESVLYLVGHASDVAQARLLTTSLQVQAMVAMRAWWSVERHRYHWFPESDKRRARSGFVRGFGAGAAERIRQNRRAIVEEAGNGTELVLAARRDRVDAAVAAMSTRRARSREGADPAAYYSGRQVGLDANTGESTLPR